MAKEPRFSCQVDGCKQKFRTKAEKDAHRVKVHGKASHYPRPVRSMSPSEAYDFVDALDLPDGAHWAMIEELSGAEPGDFA